MEKEKEWTIMKNKLDVFKCHGVDFSYTQGDQEIGRCPFCTKKDHFYVNKCTGQWDCKKCGESGNIWTFLKKYADMVYSNTTTAQYKTLAKARGLAISALRGWKLSWDGMYWLMPVLIASKICRDIRRWKPKTSMVMSTKGCKSQLYGGYKAAKAKTIWLCEGEWDTIAMSWLLERNGALNQRAVGVPGASTFKDEWVEQFTNKSVYLCYDKDIAGEQGTLKAFNKLSNVTQKIKIIKWPATLPDKYDIRDFIQNSTRENKRPPQMLKELKTFLAPPSKMPLFADEENVIEEQEVILDNPPTFNETLKIFSKWCRMKPDLVQALKIMYAVVLSTKTSGEPLWFYIVGPAGCGKTMLLMSLAESGRCVFRSNISAHSLISGYNGSYDPSLLPKLRGKCCIWKDFTEILGKKSYEKDEIYSTLRGAYDGHVLRSWGNNIVRDYPDLHFSMLAGVTPAIHGDRKASLGERFLKFEIYGDPTEDTESQIRAAIDIMSFEIEQRDALQKASTEFLSRDTTKLPMIPEWTKTRVIALAQIISKLRIASEREMFGDRAVIYKPIAEVGTRLAKQLLKLGQFLALVSGRNRVAYRDYMLMEKVGFATSIKTHLEILCIIKKNKGRATEKYISDTSMLARSSIARQLHDMQLLGVVKRVKKGRGKLGRSPYEWYLSKEILNLWGQAQIGIKPKKY